MADTDSLSPDKLEKVMHFQEVSGCTDPCISVEVLTANDWQVEAAIHQHLTQTAAAAHHQNKQNGESNSESSDVRRRLPVTPVTHSEPSSSSQQTTADETNNQQVVPVHRSGFKRLLSYAAYLGFYLPTNIFIRWPLNLSYWALSSLFGIAHSLLYSNRTADATHDMQAFIRAYEEKYSGVPRPPMYTGSYNQALSNAKQNLNFLMVYLHCSDHLNSDKFCRDILSNPRLINYINDNNIIFWACDVALAEGYRVSQALRENGYPFIALMVLRNGRMSVVGRMEGSALLDPEFTITTLARFHNASMPDVTAARLSRLEREQAVALRAEQDTAYQASLRADREKARKKLEEEKLERERQLEEKRKEEQEKDRKIRLKEMIPEEPPADSPGALQLLVKLPSGERLERRFHVNHPLSALYSLIYTHEDAPDRFEVTTNFPRKVVPCHPPPMSKDSVGEQNGASGDTEDIPITFGEFGIVPKTVLFVKDLDA